MTLLLDTQIMLWWLQDDARLRAETRTLIASTPCRLSVASLWEVAIKHRLGKLAVDPVSYRDESLAAGATLLDIQQAHVIETGRLPAIHEDPFDRLIIAQARIENFVAVSSDARWDQYEVQLRRP
jgi:PIN domain nuclease of toxin-antitoxin system